MDLSSDNQVPSFEKLSENFIKEAYTFPATRYPDMLLIFDELRRHFPETFEEPMARIDREIEEMVNTQSSSVTVYNDLTKRFEEQDGTLLKHFDQIRKQLSPFDEARIRQEVDRISRTLGTRIKEINLNSLLNFPMRSVEYRLINQPGTQYPNSQIFLIDETTKIKRIISALYKDHQQLYQIQPFEFEQLVAELLRKQNYEVELTKKTRDGGFDLIALNHLGKTPIRFLVECKRYSSHRKIGVDIIRSFSDVLTTTGNMGMICTSSYFSPDAVKYKQNYKPYLLHLQDHDDIIDWVNQYIDGDNA